MVLGIVFAHLPEAFVSGYKYKTPMVLY